MHVDYPFRLLLYRHRLDIDGPLTKLIPRLRCERCRRRPRTENVTAWRTGDGQPDMSYLGRGARRGEPPDIRARPESSGRSPARPDEG